METYLGENTKKLGFGLMRLPKKDGEIDVEQMKEMVDLFMAAGFTYFDTAFVYSGSEEAMKKATHEYNLFRKKELYRRFEIGCLVRL